MKFPPRLTDFDYLDAEEVSFMDRRALSDIARKKRVFAHAEKISNIAKACRYFGISRETYYK